MEIILQGRMSGSMSRVQLGTRHMASGKFYSHRRQRMRRSIHPVQACKIESKGVFLSGARGAVSLALLSFASFGCRTPLPLSSEDGHRAQQLKPPLVHGVRLAALYLADVPASQNEAFIRLLRSERIDQEHPYCQTGCHQHPPRITIPLRGSIHCRV